MNNQTRVLSFAPPFLLPVNGGGHASAFARGTMVNDVPLAEATQRMKSVPLNCDTMLTARDLGICFGD